MRPKIKVKGILQPKKSQNYSNITLKTELKKRKSLKFNYTSEF